MNIVGIDPGGSGAMFVIYTGRRGSRLFKFDGKTEHEIANAIIAETLEPCFAFYEKVHSMPGNGVATMFKFGRNYGFIRGVMTALGIPWRDILPGEWQRAVGLGRGHPKQSDRKKAHKAMAEQLYPAHRPTLQTADAILIAEAGYRIYSK